MQTICVYTSTHYVVNNFLDNIYFNRGATKKFWSGRNAIHNRKGPSLASTLARVFFASLDLWNGLKDQMEYDLIFMKLKTSEDLFCDSKCLEDVN